MVVALWGLGILCQVANIAFTLKQLTHPYSTRRWRVAWSWALVAHVLVIALRMRQAVLMGFAPVVGALSSPTWEQWMPLSVSVALLMFNWHVAKIFFAQRSRILRHAPPPP